LSFNSDSVLHAIHQEEDLIQHHEEQGLQPSSTVLAEQSCPCSKVICSHCKRPGHLTDFCIQPGGKMAGRSPDDARTAQCAASGCPACGQQSSSTSSSANIATSQDPAIPVPEEPVETIVLNGKTYVPSPAAPSGDFAGTTIREGLLPIPDSSTTFSYHTYEAYAAINGPTHVSLDWAEYSKPVDPTHTNAQPVAYSTSCVPASDLDSSPFILDTGATIHILCYILTLPLLFLTLPHLFTPLPMRLPIPGTALL
jgi:hypothetical protein